MSKTSKAGGLVKAIASEARKNPDSVIHSIDSAVESVQSIGNRISQRMPTAVSSTEDVMGGELNIDLDAMINSGEAFEKNIQKMSQYPQLTSKASTTKGKALDYKSQLVDNLLEVHDSVPSDVAEQSKLWYDGANKIAVDFSQRFGISQDGVSAAMAALSPQKDWFMNASLAERVMDIIKNKTGNVTDEMIAKSKEIFSDAKYADDLSEVVSKPYKDLNDTQKAMFVRMYDEAHNNRSHRIVSPDGRFLDYAKTQKGVNKKTGWGSLGEIAKAVSVIEDPSIENITKKMGGMHKVRNFYNNINVPNDTYGDVTIDTHAVAAALNSPFSGKSTAVAHNFGTGASSSSKTGAKGTYGIYADAYREAAEQVNLLPREMQSVTWEAVRGKFDNKSASVVKDVEDIWSTFQSGSMSLKDARAAILERVDGIKNPDWYGAEQTKGFKSSFGDEEASAIITPDSKIILPKSQKGETNKDQLDFLTKLASVGVSVPVLGGLSIMFSNKSEGAIIDEVAEFGVKAAKILSKEDPQKVARASRGGFSKPNKESLRIKKEYQKSQGLSTNASPRISKLDTVRSREIADAFDEMKHDPTNPEVLESYNALATEVQDQYQMLLDNGVSFEYMKGQGEPYKNSKDVMSDIRDNKRLKVLATEGNFGQEAITAEELAENPMLQQTHFIGNDGKPLLVNDVFRAVHDYLGHSTTGTGFGAIGEEGAWEAHSRMFSPLARRALTTETRGQNSWVNYGKQLRREDGSIPQKGDSDYIKPQDKPFADQKIGLLPEKFSESDYNTFYNDPTNRAIGAGTVLAGVAPNAQQEIDEIEKSVPQIMESVGQAEKINNYLQIRAEGGGADAEKAQELIPKLQDLFDFKMDGVVSEVERVNNASGGTWLSNHPSLEALVIGTGRGMNNFVNLADQGYMNLTGDEEGLAKLEDRRAREDKLFNPQEGYGTVLADDGFSTIGDRHPIASQGGEMIGEILMTLPAGTAGGLAASKAAGALMPRMLAGSTGATALTGSVGNVGAGASAGAHYGALEDEALEDALIGGVGAAVGDYLLPRLVTNPAKKVWNKKDDIAEILMRGMGY